MALKVNSSASFAIDYRFCVHINSYTCVDVFRLCRGPCMSLPTMRWSWRAREALEKSCTELEDKFWKYEAFLQTIMKESEDMKAHRNNAKEKHIKI